MDTEIASSEERFRYPLTRTVEARKMVERHNVTDRLERWIGSYNTTGRPVEIAALTEADKGRGVIYTAHHGDRERGVLSSWSDKYVFVRFTTGCTAAACDPLQLELEH